MALDDPRYDDPTRWTPRHYGDELHEEGVSGRDPAVHLFDTGVDTTDRLSCCKAKVRCPNCDRRIEAARLVDVRHVPDDLSDGAAWACDGCWTAWTRPNGRSRVQRMSEAEWVALHGAPKAVVDRFRNLMARRQAKRQQVALRLTDRLDLDAVPEDLRLPSDLPPLPERAEGRGP